MDALGVVASGQQAVRLLIRFLVQESLFECLSCSGHQWQEAFDVGLRHIDIVEVHEVLVDVQNAILCEFEEL